MILWRAACRVPGWDSRWHARSFAPMAAELFANRARAVEAASSCTSLLQMRILIVEDDPHILLGLEEILKSEGYEVVVCARGDKALDAVAKSQPGLVILDVMLPG